MRMRALAALVAATSAFVVPALAAEINIDAIAGIYKRSFINGDTSGAKFRSEDTLEIVKASPNTVFLRTHLEFFNGHQCELSGIAKLERDALIYRGDTNAEGKRCMFTLRADRRAVRFEDPEGACRATSCGARGGYDGRTFSLSRRRPIRDLGAIRKSEEYKAAIEEFEAEQKKTAR
jgi:hypothetical protein